MKLLPFQYVLEKNNLESNSPWLLLVDITLRNKYTSRDWVVGESVSTGDLRKYGVEIYEAKQDHTTSLANAPDDEDYWIPQSTTYRLVKNTEIVTFKGYDYQPYNFIIDSVVSSNDGQMPQASLKLSNINNTLRPILNSYKGGKRSLCKVYLVNYDNIAYDNEATSAEFIIDQPTSTTEWVTLTLISGNPLNKRFPQLQYVGSYCPWFFKGCECGYSGTEFSTCGHTFEDCKERGREVSFGGFLGLQGDFMRLV